MNQDFLNNMRQASIFNTLQNSDLLLSHSSFQDDSRPSLNLEEILKANTVKFCSINDVICNEIISYSFFLDFYKESLSEALPAIRDEKKDFPKLHRWVCDIARQCVSLTEKNIQDIYRSKIQQDAVKQLIKLSFIFSHLQCSYQFKLFSCFDMHNPSPFIDGILLSLIPPEKQEQLTILLKDYEQEIQQKKLVPQAHHKPFKHLYLQQPSYNYVRTQYSLSLSQNTTSLENGHLNSTDSVFSISKSNFYFKLRLKGFLSILSNHAKLSIKEELDLSFFVQELQKMVTELLPLMEQDMEKIYEMTSFLSSLEENLLNEEMGIYKSAIKNDNMNTIEQIVYISFFIKNSFKTIEDFRYLSKMRFQNFSPEEIKNAFEMGALYSLKTMAKKHLADFKNAVYSEFSEFSLNESSPINTTLLITPDMEDSNEDRHSISNDFLQSPPEKTDRIKLSENKERSSTDAAKHDKKLKIEHGKYDFSRD